MGLVGGELFLENTNLPFLGFKHSNEHGAVVFRGAGRVFITA